MDMFTFEKGSSPLLISIPHSGTYIPLGILSRMTEIAREMPDTDRHVKQLYAFASDIGASTLTATHSRYVVDLNRAPKDENLYPGQLKTGIMPLETFSGEALYKNEGEPDSHEKITRISAYWRPYHQALAQEVMRIKQEFGYAVLYDAHSIASKVERLFDGVLPDLNLGTANGKTCSIEIENKITKIMVNSSYTSVTNGRFIGGYITRHYGAPEDKIYAVQMELVQKNYMQETTPFSYLPAKAKKLQCVLKDIIKCLV